VTDVKKTTNGTEDHKHPSDQHHPDPDEPQVDQTGKGVGKKGQIYLLFVDN